MSHFQDYSIRSDVMAFVWACGFLAGLLPGLGLGVLAWCWL